MKYQSCVSLVAVLCIAPVLAGVLQQSKIKSDIRDLFDSGLQQNLFFDLEGPSTKIIGGQEAAPNQFPYQALLRMYNLDISITLCGGIVIARSYVMTAAHCLHIAFIVQVTLGAYNITLPNEPDRQTYLIVAFLGGVAIHENFNPNTLQNDIAIIRLPYPANLTAAIQPIALPSATANFTGMNATASGWGVLAQNGSAADTLRYAVAPIENDQICVDAYGNVYKSTNVCWGGSEGKTACFGDSGGPLTVTQNNTNVVVGIVSFGNSNCSVSFPTGFTKVPEYLVWIEEKSGVTPPN